MEKSILQEQRYSYKPALPRILRNKPAFVKVKPGDPTEAEHDQDQLKKLFPETYGDPVISFVEGENTQAGRVLKVGVILSGGQAPGGHNVITGLFDGLKSGNQESRLFGFRGGPSGLVEDDAIELTEQYLSEYRNTGGFDVIGSGRTKLESEEQFERVVEVCKSRGITALVVIGGDDSNTNAAVLGEFCKKRGTGISVVGVPKTIDGDLKNDFVESSFGFDTATKTYSELIGNIMRDANSAKKYWHFIKLMGRSASHIALECALKTHPNYCIISEEVEASRMTLDSIVSDIVDLVIKRGENGENYGVVLIPEGVVEFIPEMNKLITELNSTLSAKAEQFAQLKSFESQVEWVTENLSSEATATYTRLPSNIQMQLLMDRDPHGNVQVSRIETEKLIIQMVETRIEQLRREGDFSCSFSPQNHFFGYEGRAAFPSNFDANYCYSLGYNASFLAANSLTGYMSTIGGLAGAKEEWSAGGIPITMLMNMEIRHGHPKPVIRKALVDLRGRPFTTFAAHRDGWGIQTSYLYPGAIQYYGPAEICDAVTETLTLERG